MTSRISTYSGQYTVNVAWSTHSNSMWYILFRNTEVTWRAIFCATELPQFAGPHLAKWNASLNLACSLHIITVHSSSSHCNQLRMVTILGPQIEENQFAGKLWAHRLRNLSFIENWPSWLEEPCYTYPVIFAWIIGNLENLASLITNGNISKITHANEQALLQ